MKVCSVPSCRKDSTRCPGVTFFDLPKDPCAKSEWLEALGLKYKDSNHNVRVCDAHFRSKDFCSGRRQLKRHAVPALNLGIVKSDSYIDDEFMHCDSDNDADILAEVKKFSEADAMMDHKIKEEENENPPEASETGRRPSRRAAREAAKKIYNTVRNYGYVPDANDPEVVPSGFASKAPSTPRYTARQRHRAYLNIKVPPPNIDLLMECHEELLSTVQAEALLQAQLQYNMVMKTLRNLKASNVRIICAPPDPILSENSDDISDTEQSTKVTVPANSMPNENTAQPIKSETVYPMELSTCVPSPAPILS